MRKLIGIVLALLILLLVGCGGTMSAELSTDATAEAMTEPEDTGMKHTYSILFIGNSYTYCNDMPTAIFERIAEEAGYQVEVTAITKGAYHLSQFADPTDEYGAAVEEALTGTKKYDFVILQEQSVHPAAENAPDFYSAVRNLSERIKATGAEPVLYATWGRKTGSSTLDTYGWTNESMTWKLAAAYQAIGDELGIPVVHVGLAFYDVYTTQSNIELYNSDKSHPSYAGSYLAAATLFAGIFDADPTDIIKTGNLSSILCEAARKVVFETPSIPDEYQTTSEGVG
ncbi:MAG: SGNH/GDSL hydrolase family protein [Ruminococcaceae bacterium]|nr:SGNH/GDSL hydrolase family protein [Oscillospiraceae bacterium]